MSEAVVIVTRKTPHDIMRRELLRGTRLKWEPVLIRVTPDSAVINNVFLFLLKLCKCEKFFTITCFFQKKR